jgi:hypothetical protein
MPVMSGIEQRAKVGGTVLRKEPRRHGTRLPVGVAIPLIAVISAALWMGLFRLFGLLLGWR